jgi:hypothetical protein
MITRIGPASLDLPASLQAAAAGQADVEDYDVGGQRLGLIHRFAHRSGLAHHLHV